MQTAAHAASDTAPAVPALLHLPIDEPQPLPPVVSDVEALRLTTEACVGHPQANPPGTDLAEEERRFEALHAIVPTALGLAESLAIACRAWRQVGRDVPGDAQPMLTWQAGIGGTLLLQGHEGLAATLLEHAYARCTGADSPQSHLRAQIAEHLGVAAFKRDDTESALQWSMRKMRAVRSNPSAFEEANMLLLQVNHAAVLGRARRHDEAGVWLDALRRLLEPRLPDMANLSAGVANLQAANARRQSRYAEALGHAKRNLDLHLTYLRNDPARLANAWQFVGGVQQQLAQFDEAQDSLQEAVAVLRQARVHGAVYDLFGLHLRLLNSLSALQLARGKPELARATAEEAVQQTRAQTDTGVAFLARPLRHLAEAQLASGDLAGGLNTYRNAAEQLRQAGLGSEADTRQPVRLGYARALIDLGDLPTAAQLLGANSSLPRPTVVTAPEVADEHLLLAALARRRGDVPAALAALQSADAALAPSLPASHPSRRGITAAQCELAARVCEVLVQAVAGGEADTWPADTEAMVRLAISRGALAAGANAQAQAQGEAGRALAAALASGQPRLQWQAYLNQAEAAAQGALLDEAVFFGKLAIASLQQQRATLWPLGAGLDAMYMADKVGAFRRVAHWLLQRGRLPEALEVMRLLKQQEQDEYLARGAAEAAVNASAAAPSLTSAERQALQRFQAEIAPYSAHAQELHRLGRLAAAGRITPSERERLELLSEQVAVQRRGGQAKLLEALSQLRLAGGPAVLRPGLATPWPLNVATAASRPPPGTLRVWLLAGERTLDLVVAGPHDLRHEPIAMPAGQLANAIAELHDTLQRPGGDGAALGRRLYQAFGHRIDALARAQKAQRIELWLDGPLRYLPFGLLHNGRHFLAERYALVTQAPAGRVAVVGAATVGSVVRPSITAFGVTRPWEGLPALPAVADEVCNIVNGPVLGLQEAALACGGGSVGGGPLYGEGWLNSHFTEASLSHAAEMGRRSVLHIGTHFVLRPGNVANSWLLLGDGQRLALRRLRMLTFASTRLITLSACETGVVDSAGGADGREVDGLAATLLEGGAQQVLASLWRVDDQATAHFMRLFYAAYARQNGNAATALRQTQQQALAAGWPQRDWAAFTLIGAAASQPLQGSPVRLAGTAPKAHSAPR